MMPCCWARTLPLALAVVTAPVSALTRDEIVDGVQALTAYSQQWPMLWPVVLAAMAVLFMLFAVRGWRALLPHMSGFDHLLWGLLTLGGALPALGVILGQGWVSVAWLSYAICAAAVVMLLLAMRHATRRWPGALILTLGAALAAFGPAWHVWRGEADDVWYFVLCAGWVLSQLLVGLPLALRLEAWSERAALSAADRESTGDVALRERIRESLALDAPPARSVARANHPVSAAERAESPGETPSVLPPVRSDNPLYAQIGAAIECARSADEPLAVFCVRVANAVDASRILGAHVVEEAMGELARRLAMRLPRRQQALRMGASNFIVLHEDTCDQATLTALADKAAGVFAQPCEHPEGMLRLNGQVAYAVLGVDGHDAPTLVRAALTRAASRR